MIPTFSTLARNDETDLLGFFGYRKYRMQGSFTCALWFKEVMEIARAKLDPFAPR